jgi:hypothetical protein
VAGPSRRPADFPAPSTTVPVLLHHNDRGFQNIHSLIKPLIAAWQAEGQRVDLARGGAPAGGSSSVDEGLAVGQRLSVGVDAAASVGVGVAVGVEVSVALGVTSDVGEGIA